nr:Protein-tyrosine phosphatase domain containing protein [Haemonchus contortus]
MDYLSVPGTPQQPRRRDLDVPRMWNELRKKSISELSLVFDVFRGPSPSTSQTTPSKGGRRRRRMQNTWKALSASNLARHYVLVQEEKAMQAVPTAPIDANKFVAYVTERRKKRILFKGEYLMINRSIDAAKCRCDVGSTLTERNPYPDTLPYDYNRVILPRLPCDENSHYVNASYVNSWLREKAYVVTQAVRTKPMNVEFWRMVWELGSNCIVMLTKVFDFMRVMCLQYWPLTRFTFGDIEVETVDTHTYAHFVIRTFRLTRKIGENQESRIVKHFHFTEWELDSFPYISAFIELRRRVRQFTDKNPVDAPIIVHCRCDSYV